MPRVSGSTQTIGLFVCGIVALALSGIEVPMCESAGSQSITDSTDLKIRGPEGKKVTLHGWTVEGDSLRGAQDVWIKYEKVRVPVAFALAEITLDDEKLPDSLRTEIEARRQESIEKQRVAAAANAGKRQIQTPPRQLRVWLDESPWYKQGTFVMSSPESLWLVRNGSLDTLVFARARLARAQSPSGQGSQVIAGAVIGGLVGAGVFGIINSLPAEEANSEKGDTALGICLLGGAGALLGALIGHSIKTDKWVDDRHLGMSLDLSTESIRMSVGVGPTESRQRR